MMAMNSLLRNNHVLTWTRPRTPQQRLKKRMAKKVKRKRKKMMSRLNQMLTGRRLK